MELRGSSSLAAHTNNNSVNETSHYECTTVMTFTSINVKNTTHKHYYNNGALVTS